MAKALILNSIFISYVALISLVHPSRISGFTTDLIHRESPLSPSYDPSLLPSQRLVKALKRSLNRVQLLKTKRSKQSPEADISPTEGEFLVKYSVGTPPVSSLGIADTGSDIIWTQCRPCVKCFNQSSPIFEPKNSRTYRKVGCNTTICNSLQDTYCDKNKRNCKYSETYADNSFTYGELASDTFALTSSDGKMLPIPHVEFGCGFNNGGIFSGAESGIVGLGGGKASLIRQLGRLAQGRFSYCLTSADHSNSSKLVFGGNARVSGKGAVSTPFIKRKTDNFYYLTLEGISVGNQRLNFYNRSLSDSEDDDEGNIIIDSGTTLTFLPTDFYTKLEDGIKSKIKLKQIQDPEGFLNLCYETRDDIKYVPNITVHFKGADVKWKHDNVFVRTSNVSLCLAAMPQDFPIYGNLAQINFLVGYDLKKKTVSFKPTDCGK